ncbi:MAG TPA: hypothetical protein DHV85_05060, partial [Candidatus Accumulibacter sp.]|nr:hypothetical protein [Accumulibacter sp.]
MPAPTAPPGAPPPQGAGFSNPEQPLPNETRHTLRIVVRADNAAPEVLGVLVNGQPVATAAGGGALRIAASEGDPLEFEVFAHDSDADLLDWRVAGLPRGMLFTADGNRAVLTWTPDAFAAQDGNDPSQTPGLWRLTLTASDGMAEFSRLVEITVANVNQAPRILPMPLQLIDEGETLAFTLVATDPDRDAVQLSLVHDQNTPAGVSFNAASGRFEWTPDQSVVDNRSADDQPYGFTFRATDGHPGANVPATLTVQARVFDVNRRPRISASNHAVVIGDSLSIPVVFGGASNGIAVSDPDGASQTAALAISFSGLPAGASYDAQQQRLDWTPGPGQLGDYTVTAWVSDGRPRNATTSAAFILRVVADATANAPKILVSTTPSAPAVPGQSVLVSVRADAWSGIASVVAEMRDSQGSDWQSLALDAAGRVKVLPAQPGLIELRVTATDRDGFVSRRVETLRVKDPADTTAPLLTWSGALTGASADSQPRTLRATTAVAAQLTEAQLLGWRLQMAPAGSGSWQTLAEAQTNAASSPTAQALALPDLDPHRFDNGIYRLRLTAWDVAGRSSEIAARVLIETADKTFVSQLQTDASATLAGHTLALARQWREAEDGDELDRKHDGDFGNWTLPLLATRLTSDQPATLASGATAAWSEGARVWLSVPADLADASAGLTNLSFTLSTQNERLGSDAGAPQLWHPRFTTDQGWTLQAHATEDHSTPDSLQRQGDRLYQQVRGLPWLPAAYTLSAPDGTRYALDAQGAIGSVRFADGQTWLVSDAGIAAVGGDPGERIDFLRDSSGRIVRVTAPEQGAGNGPGHAGGGATAPPHPA